MRSIILLTLILAGCSDVTTKKPSIDDRILQLEIIASSLEAVVYSDFSSCPNSGDTADPLIRKICQVAQAATVEAKVEMKGQLAAFSQALNAQIDALNDQVGELDDAVSAIEATLTLLDARMTSAESAIDALESLTASITGTLNGTMIALDIGSENSGAGPLYESVLRRVDKKRFTGYVQAFAAYQGFGNNPLTAVNGSSTVTATLTAHGYVAGDRVELAGLVGSRGFSNGHVTGVFVVQTAAANSFTLLLSGTASSGGTLGGSAGSVRKVTGEGMGTLWKSDDASDVAVRVSNLGTKRYNFILRRIASDSSNDTAELCYDTTNHSATFATINAAGEGGAGNIVCK